MPYVYEEDTVVVKPFNALEPEATRQYLLMSELTPLLSKDMEAVVRPTMVKKATITFIDCLKKEVGVRSLIEVVTINDVQQSFKIDASLYLHWNQQDNANDNNRTASRETTGVTGLKAVDKPQWVPLITFSNADRIEPIEESYFSDGGTYYAHLNWTIVIHSKLDLRHFPFDRQILMVVFSSHNCSFKDYDYTLGFVCGDKPLHDMISAVYRSPNWTFEKLEVETLTHRGDALNVLMFMRREPLYCVSNIATVSFGIVLCSFTVCILDISDYGDRVLIALILLLTIVSFRYSIISWIPPAPYMTHLDKYNLLVIMVLMAVVLECFIVAAYGDEHRNRWIELDGIFYKWITVVWVIIHLLIYVGACTQWCHQSMEQVRKSLEDTSSDGKGVQSIPFKKIF